MRGKINSLHTGTYERGVTILLKIYTLNCKIANRHEEAGTLFF